MKGALDFLDQHLASLSGVEWAVVLVLSLLIGGGLFFVFRWLYESRLTAQRDLLDLRTEESEVLRTKIAWQSDASAALAEELRSLELQQQTASEQLQTVLKRHDTASQVINDLADYIVHLRSVLLLVQMRVLECDQLSLAFEKYLIYSHLSSHFEVEFAPPPALLLSQLVKAFAELRDFQEALKPLTSVSGDQIDVTVRLDLRAELDKMENRPATAELQRLESQADQSVERFRKAMQ
jgi:hypothetical protein